MDMFEFKARRPSGEVVSGKLNAANEAAVVSYIREQGMYATQIKKEIPKKKAAHIPFLNKKLLYMTLRCSAASLPRWSVPVLLLVGAIEIMIEQTTNQRFKEIIQKVGDDVRKGLQLSAALAGFPDVFPILMVHMIEAGEAGGMLETVLYRFKQYEKDYRLNAKLKSAMVYPAVVISVAVIVVTIILTFVMPTFVGLFKSMNVKLPWPTLFVMSISSFLVNYWWVILAFFGLVTLAYKEALKKKEFRMWRDGFYLSIPILGVLYNKIIIARFASTFASLSRSGVPILSALTIVSKATGSLQAEEVFKAASVNVQKGRGLSVPMEQSKLFPPLVVNMVAIGEETGSLDHMLDKISEFYSAEVDDMMGRLQALLDPFLIVILGVIVGFIAVAMLLPMFDIITKVGSA
ncbi:MAG: type II secretion system F family protein [Acidaminococcaceae bacterium]